MLQGLEIGEKVADLVRLQPELGYRRVDGHDAFREGSGEIIGLLSLANVRKGGAILRRAFSYFADGVAARAVDESEPISSLFPLLQG